MPTVAVNSNGMIQFDVKGDFLQNRGVVKECRMIVEADPAKYQQSRAATQDALTDQVSPPDARNPVPAGHARIVNELVLMLNSSTPPATAWSTSKWDKVDSQEMTLRSGCKLVHDQAQDKFTVVDDQGATISGPHPDTHLNMPFSGNEMLKKSKLDPYLEAEEKYHPTPASSWQKTTIWNERMMEEFSPEGDIKLSYDNRDVKDEESEFPRYKFYLSHDGGISAEEDKVTPTWIGDTGPRGEYVDFVRSVKAEELEDGTIRAYLGEGKILEVKPFVTRAILNGRAPNPPSNVKYEKYYVRPKDE